MKKWTLVVLCISIFITPWNAVGLSVETPAAREDYEEIDSSGDIMEDCVGSGSGEEIQSGDSSAESSCESDDDSPESGENLSESGESSIESTEGSGDRDENFLNVETLHASSEHKNYSDLIFLDSLEAPIAEIEASPTLLVEGTDMSGQKDSMENTIDDDDEDF